jgi:adenylylsulfate kinase
VFLTIILFAIPAPIAICVFPVWTITGPPAGTALFVDAGLIVLASFISPLASMRSLAREKTGDSFIEVYVKADVETCCKRDPKGLYKKARAGEIPDFTGVTAPYEVPRSPDLVLDTERYSIEECVRILVDKILQFSVLK